MDRLRTAQIQIDLFVRAQLNRGRLDMAEVRALGNLREAKQIIGNVEAWYVARESLDLRSLPKEIAERLAELGGQKHEPNTE